jgi:hypothetical protein
MISIRSMVTNYIYGLLYMDYGKCFGFGSAILHPTVPTDVACSMKITLFAQYFTTE